MLGDFPKPLAALSAALFMLSGNAHAEQASPLPPDQTQLHALSADEHDAALSLFRDFLSLPNDANHQDDMIKMIEWMETAFTDRGFQTQRLSAKRLPLLFAERKSPNATKTALIYLQSDGQPVDPAAWDQPHPFTPVVKKENKKGDWQIVPWDEVKPPYDQDMRVFARAASDSKGPIIQFLKALDAMDKAGLAPSLNLKVIIDTEEELGSPHLADAVNNHRKTLDADMLFIFDGPPHASNEPTVLFGARGILTMQLVAQHSGHYGNYAPNPAFHLAHILASMKSQDGRVLIPGYYDGVTLSDDVREILRAVPDDEKKLRKQLGFSKPDAVAPNLQEAVQYPSLNIRGIQSAWVGEQARTIVPATATAELDLRLVIESDGDRLAGLIRDHIEELGYFVTNKPPTDKQRNKHDYIVEMRYRNEYAAFRTDFDAPPGLIARAAVERAFGHEPILIRTSGGSVPISPFVDALGIPAVAVPTVNIDNNQHSPNENIRLGNFFDGIATLIAVLTEPAE